jgi:hypothetical protein
MEFRVDQPLSRNIPDADRFSTSQRMNTTIVPFAHVDKTRKLALYSTQDQYGRTLLGLGTLAGPQSIEASDANPQIKIKQGAVEKWEIYNTTDHTHPMHVHQVSFLVISQQSFQYQTTPTGGIRITRLIGKPSKPAPNEAGWKDTVQVNPGTVVTIEAKFDLPGKYMWHCHILEHEDHDMEQFFQVVPRSAAHRHAAAQSVAPAGTNAARPLAHATASPLVTSTTKAVAPGVRTGAPNSSATDAAISLHDGQIGSLLGGADGENPIDPLAADVLTTSRKKRR